MGVLMHGVEIPAQVCLPSVLLMCGPFLFCGPFCVLQGFSSKPGLWRPIVPYPLLSHPQCPLKSKATPPLRSAVLPVLSAVLPVLMCREAFYQHAFEPYGAQSFEAGPCVTPRLGHLEKVP